VIIIPPNVLFLPPRLPPNWEWWDQVSLLLVTLPKDWYAQCIMHL
jgi:hypothetical protein